MWFVSARTMKTKSFVENANKIFDKYEFKPHFRYTAKTTTTTTKVIVGSLPLLKHCASSNGVAVVSFSISCVRKSKIYSMDSTIGFWWIKWNVAQSYRIWFRSPWIYHHWSYWRVNTWSFQRFPCLFSCRVFENHIHNNIDDTSDFFFSSLLYVIPP